MVAAKNLRSRETFDDLRVPDELPSSPSESPAEIPPYGKHSTMFLTYHTVPINTFL